MKDLELASFQLITNAGGARSKCYEALKAAKNWEFAIATALVDEAEIFFLKAHEFHRDLIQKEAAGETIIMSLLLSHAEDQLMNAELAKEMVLEFIQVYQSMEELEKQINNKK